MPQEPGKTGLPPLSITADAQQPFQPGGPPHVDGYEVTGYIGRGGMGEVWRAVQLGTQRLVALKLLPAGSEGSQKSRSRFEREVELAARLKHPNIAGVYASGVYRGSYFYAMELIDGIPIDEYVAQKKLSDLEVLSLMKTVCEAIAHAHGHGVIHRDLKPGHILITADGQPHIIDFGLAKAKDGHLMTETYTQQGDVAGTWYYMSPEQAAGQVDEISTASDIYSLGVILYVLLTGHYPHDGATPAEIVRAKTEQEVTPPRKVRSTIGVRLDSLMLKALRRDPRKRYATAWDLVRDLENYPDGPMIAQPQTPKEILQTHFRRYYVPVAVIATLLATFAAMVTSQFLDINHVNTIALYDLFSFMVLFFLALVFAVAYFVMGKRKLDLLFTLLMLLSAFGGLCIFLMDNIVPLGALARTVPRGAEHNLLLCRLTYAAGLIGLPVELHFLFVYCDLKLWFARRPSLVYFPFFLALPGVFSDALLEAQRNPVPDRSSLMNIVPWHPVVRPGAFVYIAIWVCVQVIVQVILLRRKRSGAMVVKGPLSRVDMLRAAFAISGIGVSGDIAMGILGSKSISVYPLACMATGLVIAMALTQERMTSDFSRRPNSSM